MCLIAYVPAGKRIPGTYITAAARGNSDGIGIMSHRGVSKFVGKKATKRARRYINALQEAGLEFAVHFRYATHGDIGKDNCHPFALPGNTGYLMHNGVLSDFTVFSTDKYSDTALFVRLLEDADTFDDKFWTIDIAKYIGRGNKLCVMLYNNDGSVSFKLVNEDVGTWLDGVWYSQTYSLPLPVTTTTTYHWKPAKRYDHETNTWADTGTDDEYPLPVPAQTWSAWDNKQMRMRLRDRFGFLPNQDSQTPEKALPYEVTSTRRSLTARADMRRTAQEAITAEFEDTRPVDSGVDDTAAYNDLQAKWEALERDELDKLAATLAAQQGLDIDLARERLLNEMDDGMLPGWSGVRHSER